MDGTRRTQYFRKVNSPLRRSWNCAIFLIFNKFAFKLTLVAAAVSELEASERRQLSNLDKTLNFETFLRNARSCGSGKSKGARNSGNGEIKGARNCGIARGMEKLACTVFCVLSR